MPKYDIDPELAGIAKIKMPDNPALLPMKDEEDIIFSLIAGPDGRTCIRPDSAHVAFLVFGVPGVSPQKIAGLQERLTGYAHVLAPEAEITSQVI